MGIRREGVVGVLLLAWAGPAHASEEDVAIARASNDLACSDLEMMHAGKHYVFVGCGKKRSYECNRGVCAEMSTQRPDAETKMPNAKCVAEATANVAYLGCACIAIASKSAPPPAVPLGVSSACIE